jgi:hypothetical protein
VTRDQPTKALRLRLVSSLFIASITTILGQTAIIQIPKRKILKSISDMDREALCYFLGPSGPPPRAELLVIDAGEIL